MNIHNIINKRLPNNLRDKTRGAIIPHAGKPYAGECRKNAFEYLKKTHSKVKHIIYIAAVHSGGEKNKIYILKNSFPNTIIKNTNHSLNHLTTNLPENVQKEHSYAWVEDELNDFFPNHKIIVLAPAIKANLNTLATFIYTLMLKYPQAILIATTDLIHFGENYNTSHLLKYPEQINKWRLEEDLIDNITKRNIAKTEQLLDTHHYLSCGPRSVTTFLKVANKFKWTGRVSDYYDSHCIVKESQCLNTQYIDRYTINYKPVKSFVSYVSIIYGNYNNDDKTTLLPIDILLSIGMVKSVISRDTMQNQNKTKKQNMIYNYGLSLPKWSPLYKNNQGVFVGTEVFENEYQTNCSYGIFEDKDDDKSYSTAIKIVEASQDCYKDALKRWKNPYKQNILHYMTYKVELLDPISKWTKPIPSIKAPQLFKKDGNHGMLLNIVDGGSATYLPVVARDAPNWTIEKYMRRLSEKAGGTPNSWKIAGSTMKIYKSTSFKWNPTTNSIHIH